MHHNCTLPFNTLFILLDVISMITIIIIVVVFVFATVTVTSAHAATLLTTINNYACFPSAIYSALLTSWLMCVSSCMHTLLLHDIQFNHRSFKVSMLHPLINIEFEDLPCVGAIDSCQSWLQCMTVTTLTSPTLAMAAVLMCSQHRTTCYMYCRSI